MVININVIGVVTVRGFWRAATGRCVGGDVKSGLALGARARRRS